MNMDEDSALTPRKQKITAFDLVSVMSGSSVNSYKSFTRSGKFRARSFGINPLVMAKKQEFDKQLGVSKRLSKNMKKHSCSRKELMLQTHYPECEFFNQDGRSGR